MASDAIVAALDAPPRLAEDCTPGVGVNKIGAHGSMRGFVRRVAAAPLQYEMAGRGAWIGAMA